MSAFIAEPELFATVRADDLEAVTVGVPTVKLHFVLAVRAPFRDYKGPALGVLIIRLVLGSLSLGMLKAHPANTLIVLHNIDLLIVQDDVLSVKSVEESKGSQPFSRFDIQDVPGSEIDGAGAFHLNAAVPYGHIRDSGHNCILVHRKSPP